MASRLAFILLYDLSMITSTGGTIPCNHTIPITDHVIDQIYVIVQSHAWSVEWLSAITYNLSWDDCFKQSQYAIASEDRANWSYFDLLFPVVWFQNRAIRCDWGFTDRLWLTVADRSCILVPLVVQWRTTNRQGSCVQLSFNWSFVIMQPSVQSVAQLPAIIYNLSQVNL